MAGKQARTLKIRRKKTQADAHKVNPEAIQIAVDNALEPIQNQIKILQSNAITTMVILEDVKNSVLLAASSSESTKRTLSDLLSNLELALSNTSEFIGRPEHQTSTEFDMNHITYRNVAGEEEEIPWPESVVDDTDADEWTESDDIVESVSGVVIEDPITSIAEAADRVTGRRRRRGSNG